MIFLANVFCSAVFLWIPLAVIAAVSVRFASISPGRVLRGNMVALIFAGALAVYMATPGTSQVINSIVLYKKSELSPVNMPSVSSAPWITSAATTVVDIVPKRFPTRVFLLGLLLFGVFRMTGSLVRLRRSLRSSFEIKKCGALSIRICDALSSPYVVGLGRWHIVVLPQWALESQSRLRMILAHELQHIRQGDTTTAVFIMLLGALFFWHPAF